MSVTAAVPNTANTTGRSRTSPQQDATETACVHTMRDHVNMSASVGHYLGCQNACLCTPYQCLLRSVYPQCMSDVRKKTGKGSSIVFLGQRWWTLFIPLARWNMILTGCFAVGDGGGWQCTRAIWAQFPMTVLGRPFDRNQRSQ